MRWKPLVDCYRRHEAPGGILAVENARGLQSQTQPDETASRPSRYLRHPYPAAVPSKRYIPSIVPCTFVVINFSFFFSLSPYFFFFFGEIRRKGDATHNKMAEKNMTGSRNNFVYLCNGSRSWWKFCSFEILFTGRTLIDWWCSRGLWRWKMRSEFCSLFRWIR